MTRVYVLLPVLLALSILSSPASNQRNRGRSYSYSSRGRSRRPGHSSSSFSTFTSFGSDSSFDDSDGGSFVETFSDDFSDGRGTRKRHVRGRNRGGQGYSSYYNRPYGGHSVPVDPAYLRDDRGVDNQGKRWQNRAQSCTLRSILR